MLAVAPDLTADQVRAVVTSNVKPFPLGSTCNTSRCGPGIINAGTAVTAARVLSGAAPTVPVIEYYWASRDHYFITSAVAEIAALDAAPPGGWVRTGNSFRAYGDPAAGANPVCRFYLPPAAGDSHFYSASPDECAATRQKFPTLVYEAPDVFHIALPETTSGICPPKTTPVFRLFNNRPDGNHRYTIDRALKAQMIARGYTAEGYGADPVSMCAAQ
jgi:hypothetical protein